MAPCVPVELMAVASPPDASICIGLGGAGLSEVAAAMGAAPSARPPMRTRPAAADFTEVRSAFRITVKYSAAAAFMHQSRGLCGHVHRASDTRAQDDHSDVGGPLTLIPPIGPTAPTTAPFIAATMTEGADIPGDRLITTPQPVGRQRYLKRDYRPNLRDSHTSPHERTCAAEPTELRFRSG